MDADNSIAESAPRVLTLDEVKALPWKLGQIPVPVVREQRYPIFSWGGGSNIAWVGSDFVHVEYISTKNKHYNEATYNRTWRIWSGWPGYDLKEETPWNAL